TRNVAALAALAEEHSHQALPGHAGESATTSASASASASASGIARPGGARNPPKAGPGAAPTKMPPAHNCSSLFKEIGFMHWAMRILLLALPLALSGCLAKTAVDVVTLPVRVVSAGVDAVTTSQSEA